MYVYIYIHIYICVCVSVCVGGRNVIPLYGVYEIRTPCCVSLHFVTERTAGPAKDVDYVDLFLIKSCCKSCCLLHVCARETFRENMFFRGQFPEMIPGQPVVCA